MNQQCEFIAGAESDEDGNPVVVLCDTPASIKRNGRWLCANHYDFVEANLPGVYTSVEVAD